MNKLIRLFNQNRKKVYSAIFVIALIIGVIQFLNYSAIKNSSNKLSQVQNNTISYVTATNSNTIIKSNTSSVTGSEISSSALQSAQNIINQFLEYCNENKIDEAYELLTDECKEEVYPNVDAFKNVYCLQIFDGAKKTFTIENWTGNTYKVRMIEDLLSTGKVNNGMATQDYITIVDDDGEKKLNINSYIGRKEINKTTEREGISVTIVSKNTYIEYETYNIKVKNNTDKTICLDPLKDTDKTYLTDSKGVNFISYSYELLKNQLVIKSGYTRNIKIKFTNGYTTGRTMKNLTFKNLILDYDEYENLEDKSNYIDVYEFSADL